MLRLALDVDLVDIGGIQVKGRQPLLRVRLGHYPDGVSGKANQSADDDGDDTDFWLLLPNFRDSLIAAEPDHGAGRTFSEEEIRAHVGLPQPDADQEELRRRCIAHGKWMSDHPEAVASAEEWADGNLDELDHT